MRELQRSPSRGKGELDSGFRRNDVKGRGEDCSRDSLSRGRDVSSCTFLPFHGGVVVVYHLVSDGIP